MNNYFNSILNSQQSMFNQKENHISKEISQINNFITEA